MKGFFMLLLFIACSMAVFAQTTKPANKKNVEVTNIKVTYTCSMHPEVITDKPGKCPKCGMTLVKVSTKNYACTMHPEFMSHKPGKCSKCGMTLVEKKLKAKGDGQPL